MNMMETEISEQDNSTPAQPLMVADVKVLLQVIDRLFSVGGVKGPESLPIAVVRQKLVAILDPKRENETRR